MRELTNRYRWLPSGPVLLRVLTWLLRVLAWLIRALPERRYRIVRREILADGFMQQHVLEGVLADGQPFAMPACVVVQAKDGRITRLDEYLDPAAVAPLAAQARRRTAEAL